jgi:hypothetical protein
MRPTATDPGDALGGSAARIGMSSVGRVELAMRARSMPKLARAKPKMVFFSGRMWSA